MSVNPPLSVRRRRNRVNDQRISIESAMASTSTTTALAVVSSLFQVIFPKSSTAVSEGRLQERQLQVMSEVVSGPARGKILVLHLDGALPADVRQAILAEESVRSAPHFTLSLGTNHSHGRRSQQLPHCSSSSSSILHVVLWLTAQPEVLQGLWLQWRPRNMLLFCLGPSLDANLLTNEALNNVEKLTFIGHLFTKADRDSDALGVYTVLPFSSSGVLLLGTWECKSFSSWEALFPDRFQSFQGYTFHIASRLKDEAFFFPNVKDPQKRSGLGLQIVECLSAKLNFTYTTTKDSPDSRWGALFNGIWNGVLGMVHRREKNFTMNGFLLDINRGRYFDFSTPIHMDGYGVYLRSPDPLPNWMSIAKVFEGSVWLAVLFAFVISTCFVLLQERVRDGWLRSPAKNRPARGLAIICLDILRPLVAQGVSLVPTAVLLRVFMALWFVHCLVMTVAYTSNLVGIFTSPVYPLRFQHLQEIADSKYRVSVLDTSSIMNTALEESDDPTLRRLRRKVDRFSTREASLDAMMEDTHAVLRRSAATTVIKTQRSLGTCYRVGDLLLTSPAVFFFPKYTPWKYKFDQGIQQLLSGGLVHYWMQEMRSQLTEALTNRSGLNSQREGSADSNHASPLTLQHFQSILYILVTVWVASGAILLLELLVHHYKRRIVACRSLPSN